MGFEILVVRGGNDLRFDRALEVCDFLRPLIDQQDKHVNLRMILGNGIGDLFEDCGFASSRRRNDKAARSFAQGSDHIDHPSFEQVGRCLEAKLLNRIDRGQVFEPNGLGILFKTQAIDLFHRFELWAVSAMGRLRWARDQTPFPQEAALNRVRCDENVRRLRMKMILGCSQETKAFFRYFQVTGTELGCSRAAIPV